MHIYNYILCPYTQKEKKGMERKEGEGEERKEAETYQWWQNDRLCSDFDETLFETTARTPGVRAPPMVVPGLKDCAAHDIMAIFSEGSLVGIITHDPDATKEHCLMLAPI
jgi:hypothetical protein